MLQGVWCTAGFSPKAVAAYTSTVLAPAEQLCSSDEPVSGLLHSAPQRLVVAASGWVLLLFEHACS